MQKQISGLPNLNKIVVNEKQQSLQPTTVDTNIIGLEWDKFTKTCS